jgi:hypothetical protein
MFCSGNLFIHNATYFTDPNTLSVKKNVIADGKVKVKVVMMMKM